MTRGSGFSPPVAVAVPSAATAAPKAPGTAAVGTSAAYAREDHVHPVQAAPTGLLTPLATTTVGETLILGLSLGVRRYTVSVPGTATTDRIVLALTGAPQNGTLQDAYVSAAGTVSVGLLIPALAIGAVIAVPLAIYKVT